MRKLIVFNNVTLDGYFTDKNGDMSWANRGDADQEWIKFAEDNTKSGGLLVFGRVTYELMASYWPTPDAAKNEPVLTERMNNLPKVVFSQTLDDVSWNNTELLKGDLVSEVRRMKSEPGHDMVIFGSGTIISQLAPEGLIDEYQIVVIPIALGEGRTMFDGIGDTLALKQKSTRVFDNGNVVLCYEPTAVKEDRKVAAAAGQKQR